MFDASVTSGGVRWPVVRISAHGETEVVVVGDRFLPLTVHWCERSVPCAIDDCALCMELPGRGLFYLPVMWLNRLAILELAALSSSHLEQHCRLLHGGMKPGLVVRCKRGRKQAPVHTEVVAEKAGVQGVEWMTFATRVMRLYQLPCSNPGETFEHYGFRCAQLCRRRNEQIAARLRAGEKTVLS